MHPPSSARTGDLTGCVSDPTPGRHADADLKPVVLVSITRGMASFAPAGVSGILQELAGSNALDAPPLVPFQRPELPPMDAVLAYFRASEEERWYANGGPCARLLAERLADWVGGDATCVLVANCTAGLIAALRAACGAPEGRPLVITPAYTFTATACAIHWAGFEPLFVDVDPEGWQLDPGQLAAALRVHGGAVAGVLACSAFGTAPAPSVRQAWRELCDQAGVPLVIDSAPGFGATDEAGGRLGGLGDTEVFSFHATKPFAIGEGGAVFTRDPALASRMEQLVNFGLEPGTRTSVLPGFNGKLSELHAATGLAMLDRYPAVLARRRALAARLQAATEGSGLVYQRGAGGSTWQYLQALCPDAASRERALVAARAGGVQVRTLHDPPLDRHPAFASAPAFGALPVTRDVAARSLSLPLAPDLSEDEAERVAAVAHAAAGTGAP